MELDLPIPKAVDAERAVLGGLLLDPDKLSDVTERLRPEDFFRDQHRALYELYLRLSEENAPIELVSVVERLARAGMAEQVGGIDYVTGLADNIPSTVNLGYYADQIRERATERRLLSVASRISEETLRGRLPLAELLDMAERAVLAVGEGIGGADWKQLSEVVDVEFSRIQDLAKSDKDITGISTGFIDLDRILAGLHRTDLIILAARPAMGKTAFALNIARAVAGQGFGVGVFSLEMSAGQLATRLLVAESRVSAGKIRTGRLSRETDWPRLTQAAEALYRMDLFIEDTPGINISQLRAKARRLKKRCPSLALLVVDYIGLMSGEPGVSRQEQVAASSRGLKGLAKELDITILALSQLNRAVETRNPQIPVMADLRESGSIEQDADIVMFIYREEYYKKDESTRPGEADVIIAKHRNGETDTVPLAFQGELTLFSNLAKAGESYL
jgi:replicative DNA helicase